MLPCAFVPDTIVAAMRPEGHTEDENCPWSTVDGVLNSAARAWPIPLPASWPTTNAQMHPAPSPSTCATARHTYHTHHEATLHPALLRRHRVTIWHACSIEGPTPTAPGPKIGPYNFFTPLQQAMLASTLVFSKPQRVRAIVRPSSPGPLVSSAGSSPSPKPETSQR